MSETVYRELQRMLDSIPNGFPATESGVEIKILKKIFTEDEARLFMKLRMNMETVEQIAKRTGLDRAMLEEKLKIMDQKGQLFGFAAGDQSYYRIMPYVFGIYEFQLHRMDRELAELFEEYAASGFRKEYFSHGPALMKVVPIGIELPHGGTVEPYESVAALIEQAKSWAVNDCICKKEKALTGHRCDRPMEVCMALAPVENAFGEGGFGARKISKEEAYRVLRLSEEAGLVHMVSNYRAGHFFICNCCECCCGPLVALKLTSRDAVAKSNYCAVVDTDRCTACGICVDRCQADAVAVNDYAEIGDCIGCGLCVSTCPSGAISMKRREPADSPPVPEGEIEWLEQRARSRGMDDGFKRLFSSD